jgi:hypothetical protein
MLVHIQGVFERPFHLIGAETDDILHFQRVFFFVDEEYDDPLQVEYPFHFLDELLEDFLPLDGPVQEATDLVDGCEKAVLRLDFRFVFFKPAQIRLIFYGCHLFTCASTMIP